MCVIKDDYDKGKAAISDIENLSEAYTVCIFKLYSWYDAKILRMMVNI